MRPRVRPALTYVTGTVIRFGAGLANVLLGKPSPSFWIQGPLWAGLTVGAVCGGVLQHDYGEAAFLVPAAMAGLLAAIALVMTLLAPRSPLVANHLAPQLTWRRNRMPPPTPHRPGWPDTAFG